MQKLCEAIGQCDSTSKSKGWLQRKDIKIKKEKKKAVEEGKKG